MATQLQVVYVLVQAGSAPYALMTYLSALAVRRLYPDSRLILVTDPGTSKSVIEEVAPKLLSIFDVHVVEAADMPSPRARSFYLKTRVRELIAGDFLYLDSDTLPVRPFSQLFEKRWDIALAHDHNHHCPIRPAMFPFWAEDRVKKVGWAVTNWRAYLNAGIFFIRDSEAVRSFSREWTRHWWQLYSVGDDCDQLALNYSLSRSALNILVLPEPYNAMYCVHPLHAKRALIHHMFASNTDAWEQTIYRHLLDVLRDTGEVDWAELERAVSDDHPWMPPYWPSRLWHTGHRRRALVTYVATRLIGR